MIEEFDLSDFVPLETKPNYSHLRFLSDFHRTYGNFDEIARQRPFTGYVAGLFLLLDNGTQRGIFLALNELPLVVPVEVRRLHGDLADHYENIARQQRRNGVYSVRSLAAKVKKPHLYSAQGEPVNPVDLTRLQIPDERRRKIRLGLQGY